MNILGESVGLVRFGVLSPNEIERNSVVSIKSEKMFEQGKPVPEGLFDMRMGVVDPGSKCQTCHCGMQECIGHPGHIELAKPVYHIKFIHYILEILKCICPHCYRVLLDKSDPRYKKLLRIPDSVLRIRALIKMVEGVKRCGQSKKGEDNISHDACGKEIPVYKLIERIKVQCEFEEIQPAFDKKKAKFFMSAEKARDILRRIDENELVVLGCDPVLVKPHWMIWNLMPVPPPVIRPSNMSNAAARGEDDLTRKLEDIVRFNNVFKSKLESGMSQEDISAMTQVLQAHIATYIDNESLGQAGSVQTTGKPKKGIQQRLHKKGGRVRYNLMGKRLDFSGRTVISPDPNISINQIGVPPSVAKIMTFPSRVTAFNIVMLTEMVTRGPEGVDPITSEYRSGANFVIEENGKRIDLRMGDFKGNALRIGMTVERHMMNGDVVIANRQPSLHKMSIMAHRVIILPYSTFRLPLPVTTPYNADILILHLSSNDKHLLLHFLLLFVEC